MPAAPNPDTTNPKQWIARFYKEPDKRVQVLCFTRVEAEVMIANECCSQSEKDFPGFLVSSVLKLFIQYEEQRGITPAHLRQTESALKRVFLTHVSDREFGTLTEQDLIAIRKAIQKAYGDRTAYTYGGHVSRLMEFAHARGFIRRNLAPVTMRMTWPKYVAPELLFPTESEMARMIKAATPSQLVVMLMFSGVAADGQEVCRAQWPDVDFQNSRIYLRALPLPCDDPADPVGRWVPMPPNLVAALLWWKRSQDICCPGLSYIFPNTSGGQRQNNRSIRPLQALQRECGIFTQSLLEDDGVIQGKARYRFDNFRHLAALRWCAEGIQLMELKTRLGYDSIVTVFNLYGQFILRRDRLQGE